MTNIQDRIKTFAAHPVWYHTLDLGGGTLTSGTFNHRPVLHLYGLPQDLSGKTALDAGTADGFFAFEFERRGAAAVTAIDTHVYDGSIGHDDISAAKLDVYKRKYGIDLKVNAEFGDIATHFGFPVVDRRRIAASVMSSRVKFVRKSIYDLDPEEGQYDFVFCGDLMEHLKNPILAVERLREVTKELCIISLSSALHTSKFKGLAKKVFSKMVRSVPFLGGDLYDSTDVVLYKGHIAGGSFFHFHPDTFAALIKASGFSRVEMVAEFDLLEQRKNLMNHHVIYHCRP